ncbi:YdcF family protein [Hymenobacter psychrophilus]|uniref:Uncharacterized SAM-binding protein YcdF, DUF218 family n=1 Tax=Hymenobacter psychrophilus TaxID=651662 RepID=A0A1H3NI00_9BACT|nr:YdcF family protein [Hymenobacter psychrophilus]SDY88512.1 Uncharacterized SAM-binding protein YcdF, DUF218 family [Hymenobacter psychrophilus]
MFFLLSKLLDFLLSPALWITGLLLAGLLWRKRQLLWAATGLLLFFTNSFLANEALLAWERPPVTLQQLGTGYDAGILLTGITDVHKSPHDRVYLSAGADRLVHTLWLYRAGRIRHIIISGGSGAAFDSVAHTEAADLGTLLRLAGVPSRHILLETRSRNTRENAVFTQELLAQHPEIRRTVLITSAFHMRRAAGCFAKAGLHPAPFPAAYYSVDRRYTPASLLLPSEEPLRLWGVLLHEMAGYVVYKVLGYL